MSLLKTVSPNEAPGEVAAVYEQIKAAFGGVQRVEHLERQPPFT